MKQKPNIILILVDDMGFSDLGCTGSEIHTPNIDALARNGALLTSMYNCARCCPTRAALMTGLYPHNAGVGHMGTDLGSPSYQGYLREDAVTIAEHLKANGYKTLMSGKWHISGRFDPNDPRTWETGSPQVPTPRQRGFDRFFGILEGAAHYYSPQFLMEDDDPIDLIPDDFYFTDAITDKAIQMIDGAGDDPYFLYLAHTAPHWPLHAPPEEIARYDGVYQRGWDTIRTERHERMNGLGILQNPWAISARDQDVHAWAEEPHKDWEASKMATYAAMIDRLDQSVGRLVDALKKRGQFDDTVILFLSDNGGCAEFMAEDGWARFYPIKTHDGQPIALGNIPNLRPGDAQTFQSYDKPWANVSNAPFRQFKHFVHEGGISTPLIAHCPGRITPQITHEPTHVIDILPTILSWVGATPLGEVNARPAQTMQGEDLSDLLCGHVWQRKQPIFFEHEGNAAIRDGPFKMVRLHGNPWELYDMHADRTELADLAGRNTPVESDLLAQYADWANKCGVRDWSQLSPLLLQAWGMSSIDG